MKPHTAMVFAAGLGKRMRPLTDAKPKPLIEVAGRTLLDRALDHLTQAGVKRVIVNTHYLAEQISRHLQSRTDLEIHISHEPELLETGGGLKKALPLLGETPIYVMNSDVVLMDGATPALPRLAQEFDAKSMDVLLLLIEKEKAIGYEGNGDFGLEKNGRLTRQGERPFVFTGFQIIKPSLVAKEAETIFSLNKYYFDNSYAFGQKHDGAWLHVGTPAGLAEAEAYLKATFKTS